MNPASVFRWASVATLAAGCLWVTLDVKSCVGKRQVNSDVVQADAKHDEAKQDAAQGAKYDVRATAQATQVSIDDATVVSLRAEVAWLRAASRPAPAAPGAPEAPAPQPVGPAVDLAPLVAKQDELVAALTKENVDLKIQVNTLTLARDAWKGSADASAAEAVQLRAALAAQQGVAAANLWRGRIEGFAVGVASGYVTGRLH